MCGISSIYRFTQITDSDKGKLALMNQEMHYRGPDDNGVWTDDTCGLAQTRLSIIGLSNGHQPMFNEDESLVLVCNGEIYNYTELKNNLQAKGHVFQSDSDSETILHLYEEYGENCLSYLRGMFAFILYDRKNKKLFAARDRVGEKILYYSQLPTGIVFSTELKAIVKYYVEKIQINTKNLAESIRYNYPIENKHTYIEQVNKLQAGEFAFVDEKGIEFHKYWNRYCLPKFVGTKEDAKEEVLRLIRESVSGCMQSDVPIAVLLSGGIDSSAIAAIAKESGREIHCITAGYKGSYECDERPIAKRFASEKGLIYHEVELDAGDFNNLFEEYLPMIDEPVCDVSSMSQYALYKKAKELGFTVLLGGIGGDELFYGYPYHNAYAKQLQLRKQHMDLFPWKGKEKKMAFLKFIAKNWKNVISAGYPMKIDDSAPVDWTYRDYLMFAKNAVFLWRGEKADLNEIDVHFSYPTTADIDTVYDIEFSTFMKNLCLYLADRLGMANSIEIRSPLLDYKFVEFVSSLPTEMKYIPDSPKGFYKWCLEGIVPDYILYAQKRGFTPPFDFIWKICNKYRYKHIQANYCFFNSMLADKVIDNLV